MKSTAATMLEAQGDQPFGRTVPALLVFGHCPLAFEHFDAQLANHLRAAGVTTWADVAQLSPNVVRSWPGTGPRTVARLVQAILKALVDPHAFVPMPTPEPPPVPPPVPPPARPSVPRGRLPARRPPAVPRTVSTVAPTPSPEITARAVSWLISTVTEAATPSEEQHNREVFARLIAVREPGRPSDATVSVRARRTEIELSRRMRDALATDTGAAVHARAHELRDALGPIVLAHRPTTHEVIARATHGIDGDPEVVASLLLHLAGPYRRRETWLCLPSASLDILRRATKAAFADAGFVPTHEVADFLRSLAVADHALDDVRTRLPLREFGDQSIWWGMAVGEKALVLLAVAGASMSADDIWRTLAEGSSAPMIAKQLSSDPRAMRTTHGRWALTEWGLPAWDGTNEAGPVGLALRPLDVPRVER